MVEFTINSSVNATTGYAPLELNYGYIPRSGQHISTNTSFRGVKQFAQQAMWNLIDAHDAILEHRVAQTHYSNCWVYACTKVNPNEFLSLILDFMVLFHLFHYSDSLI